jgi:hypothetical protein
MNKHGAVEVKLHDSSPPYCIEVSGQPHSLDILSLGERGPVCTGQAGWALEPVWMQWNGEKCLGLAGN